jgi:hypothetical protein
MDSSPMGHKGFGSLLIINSTVQTTRTSYVISEQRPSKISKSPKTREV